jgi:hypothetical protein
MHPQQSCRGAVQLVLQVLRSQGISIKDANIKMECKAYVAAAIITTG